MIRKFCRVFCLVFLIGDLQTSLSQHNVKEAQLSKPNINNRAIALLENTRHQASIRLLQQEITFGEGHICGGSLITSRVVLTSAHCLFNLSSKKPRHPAELRVVLGTPNRYQRTEHTLISRVVHIRYPSTFNINTRWDDIGLLFLSQEIPEEHTSVRPIEINRETVAMEIHGAVTGWGKTESGDTSHHLIAMNVSTMDPLSCAKSFGRLITDGMLCARYTEVDRDICQSDVGAPLVHDGKQIGIVSWANSCWMTDYPEVYTDVAYHNEWIWRELTDRNNTDSSVWGLLGFLTFTWYAIRDRQKMFCKL